jgi:hypothetical protein
LNFVLPAIAPETIVVAVEQKTVANIRNTRLGRSPAAANFPAANRLGVPIKVEIVISTVPLGLLIDTIRKVLYTGKIGDGKIFVYDVANVVKIRTGAEDEQALE